MKLRTQRTDRFPTALAALLALVGLGLPLSAASFDDDEKGEDAEEEAEEEGEAEDEDAWLAVVGGDVFTGAGGILRGATVLSKNGVIEEIGYDLWMPEDTEVVSARGYRVYPGLVALSATTRISRGAFGFAPTSDDMDAHMGIDDLTAQDDWNGTPQLCPICGGHEEETDEHGHGVVDDVLGLDEPTQTQTAAAHGRTDVEEMFDPFSPYLVMALAAGITTAEQSNEAIKLRRGEIEDLSMADRHRASFSFSSRNPSSRRSLREKFAAAATYLREHREWQEKVKDDKELEEPSKKGVDSNVLRVLTGEMLAEFNADDREELLSIARLAQQYGFRPVIDGCREGWSVAAELGRAGAYAIVTPRERRDKDERLVGPGGSSIENAARLHAAGVQVAIIPQNTSFDVSGMSGRDLQHLPVEAGFAVRGGLTEQAAFEAMTIVPARLMGVDHRVGSLEVGKDCDLIITDGDIMHYETFVQWTVVAGKLVYDKEEELLYHHIRPRPEVVAPVVDPGEELPEEAAEEVEEEEDGDEDGD